MQLSVSTEFLVNSCGDLDGDSCASRRLRWVQLAHRPPAPRAAALPTGSCDSDEPGGVGAGVLAGRRRAGRRRAGRRRIGRLLIGRIRVWKHGTRRWAEGRGRREP